MEYKWTVLTVTTVGIFMATLDSSIVVVGLPQVVAELNTDIVHGVWIITIYRLMICILLVGLGRVADIYGRVRLYNMGFAVFTIGSLLSGLSFSADQLLISRLVQGTGAALLFVNSVAIVTDAFSGPELGKGIGINQVAINAGTITGYVLSGIVIGLFTWRAIFLVNVPIGIFGTYWSRKRLKELSRPAVGAKFDAVGAISFSGSITLILLGLTIAGITDPLSLSLITLGVVGMLTFVLVERRNAHPLMNLKLFKIRLFTAGNMSNLLSGLAFAALAFIMSLYFQLVRGYSPVDTGIALIPVDATLVFVGPVSGWLSDKWGARGLSTLGLIIASVGLFQLSGISTNTSYSQILISLAIIGLGIGLFRSPNASSVMGSVPAQQRGVASGIRSTMINTSIVASIPLTVGIMTAFLPYDKLVNLISPVTTSGLSSQVTIPAGDLSPFLAGLQHALFIFAAITLFSVVFSVLRGARASEELEAASTSVSIGASAGD
jgi:EmrB/QacA subfamily drug resistance transporter